MIGKKREKIDMDNKNNNNSGSNFFSGFLLGVVVGAAVVFLLGTKKGKRLLKAISEEGLDNISNILEEADGTTGLKTNKEDEKITPKRKIIVRETAEEKPRVRRFFRGISRHVN